MPCIGGAPHSGRQLPGRNGVARSGSLVMSSDAPLLDRLAGLPAVPVADLVALLESTPDLGRDPLFAGLVGVDDEGTPAVHPILVGVLEHLKARPESTCYAALIEALTGIWNAAVRGAVVARLRRTGLPADDLLLRLGQLSPTLGFHADHREWARRWLADPTCQDAQLVQRCLVGLRLAVRGLAEARARVLIGGRSASGGESGDPGKSTR